MEYQSLVNPIVQLQQTLSNPFGFIYVFFNTLYVNNYFVESLIGTFGWYNFTYISIVYLLYFFIFGYSLREFISYKKKIFPSRITLILFLICLLSFLIPFITMYFFFTPARYSQILGVQGRYFLILFPFVFLLIHQLFSASEKGKIENFLKWFFLLFITSQTFIVIFNRYNLETKKENEVTNLIKLDPQNVKYMPINKQYNFLFQTKNDKKAITGFKFYFTTHNQIIDVPYRYKLMDQSCTRTFKEGEIISAELKGDSIYQEEFPPIPLPEEKICLKFIPDTSFGGRHYLSIIVYREYPKVEIF